MDLGSGVITGLRHMQPGREEQLIPDPLGIGNALCVYLEDGSGIRNDKQPNIRHAFGGPLYRWSFASAAGFPDQEARWLYEIQPVVDTTCG